MKRPAFRAGKQWSAFSYMRLTLWVFTRDMSGRFATVNMSYRVIESLLEHLQLGESRQTSYDKRPVFNILLLLSKMGSVLQSSMSGDMTLLALCLPKLTTHFWKWQTLCISIPSPFLPFFKNLLTCHLFHRKTLLLWFAL